MKITRRDVLKLSAAAGAVLSLGPQRLLAQTKPLILKKIPSSGEGIPAIGIGTNRYGVGASEEERAPLRATLKKFAELGGRLIDTAPVYRTSELALNLPTPAKALSPLHRRERGWYYRKYYNLQNNGSPLPVESFS